MTPTIRPQCQGNVAICAVTTRFEAASPGKFQRTGLTDVAPCVLVGGSSTSRGLRLIYA